VTLGSMADKAHLAQVSPGIDEEASKVRAVEIAGSHIGDAPVLPDLLRQIPEKEDSRRPLW